MYDGLVAALRHCGNGSLPCEGCPRKMCEGAMANMREAADAIEELLKAAKAMHTWIFLNSVDEQAAYDECGLTNAMNAALGYGGQFVVEPPKEEA